MWKNMVWRSKNWKTFWEWPQSLTAKTLSSDKVKQYRWWQVPRRSTKYFRANGCKKLWTFDVNAGSHNVFILRLGSEWDIGRHTNCVVAIHSPRQPFFNEPIQKRGEPQELFRCSVEKNLQITIPINHSDFGQQNGSEDAFSELWSNKHYFVTEA